MAICATCMRQAALGTEWEPHKCALGYGTIEEKLKKDRLSADLHKRIRAQLKKRIEEIIRPDIEAAIEAAMRTFKTQLELRYNNIKDERLLKVIIEDRREKKP